jgi:phosphoribosylamine---glycine ligase
VPLPWAPDGLADEVMATVVQPAIDELARRGTPYRGLLYAGLALTAKGIKVVEFNARFGDPETQVVLDRLATPLAGPLHGSAVGDLGTMPPLSWHPGAAVTVVIAAAGYPDGPATGDVITLRELPASPRGYLLHAGTARRGGDLVTAGGRVLNAVGSGPDLAAARAAAYAIAECVEFRGGWYRRDIAERASARD